MASEFDLSLSNPALPDALRQAIILYNENPELFDALAKAQDAIDRLIETDDRFSDLRTATSRSQDDVFQVCHSVLMCRKHGWIGVYPDRAMGWAMQHHSDSGDGPHSFYYADRVCVGPVPPV